MTRLGITNVKVIGIGGAGCNAADWLYKKGITGAEIICVNTDQQHLYCVEANKKVLIGYETTRGFGCGGDISKGRAAAREGADVIRTVIGDNELVFLIAGLGGGTGTGATPYIAQLAKEGKAMVIAAVTIPFSKEGIRKEKADIGLEELSCVADTVIVIDNDKLVELAGDLPLQQAFAVANELISIMVKGIVEIVTVPSLVNLDYADIRAVMEEGGVSVVGIGESSGQNRVKEAIMNALYHPLLEVKYNHPKGALIHITGGPDLTLNEVNEAGKLIANMLHADASVVWGARVDPNLEGVVRVMTLLTGVESPYIIGMQNSKDKDFRNLGIDNVGGKA